ncbi:MAG: flagellar assembly protein FliH [Gammaproteobacteria bacterium]|nr:flagellar assembly protein FliH [Gammaproteobacteria bacterium]
MSKVLADLAAEECTPWHLPSVRDAEDRRPVQTKAEREALEEIHKAAHEEGFAAGHAAGMAAAQRDIKDQAARISHILQQLTHPLAEVDDEVVEQTCQLALRIARHIIRREISLNPGEVVAAVHKALDCLPVSSRHIRVYLNPDDVNLVRDALSTGEGTTQWRLVENPLIERGGCRVETESAEIDATIEKRLNAICAEMFGGAREEDGRAGDA